MSKESGAKPSNAKSPLYKRPCCVPVMEEEIPTLKQRFPVLATQG